MPAHSLFGCLGRQPPLSGESHETEASSLAWAISLALVPAAWAADPVELQSVVVSASGLAKQSHEMTTPVAVMENDELVLRREATLGETLESLPGVRSSSFGAGAARPVIRGLDGARVRC